jgi:hypothetical protein
MQEFVLLPSIMGRVPKSHSIHVQNPTKSHFSNKDLVWTFGICHGGQNKVTIQFAYVPYARISEFSDVVPFSLFISNSPPALFLNLLPLAITTLKKNHQLF